MMSRALARDAVAELCVLIYYTDICIHIYYIPSDIWRDSRCLRKGEDIFDGVYVGERACGKEGLECGARV